MVDVAELVDSMIEMLQSSLGSPIQITTDFQTGLLPTRVDPNQLALALLNLALNARDAMPTGGRLLITARSERSTSPSAELKPGAYVCIGIEDTGCGMDEATRWRATEPFFTTKSRQRGTGLGLSMVDGFVAQSGGAMRINSRPGVGTSIELWLPSANDADIDRRKPAAAAMRVGNGRCFRVLVVDDDPMVSSGTAAMLDDLGHSAVEAASAAQALDVLRSEPGIDIVITDYAMPGMSGSELAAKIHQIRPGLPVVIATGYADTPTLTMGLPCLDKPYRQHDLAALIETLCNRPTPAMSSSPNKTKGQVDGAPTPTGGSPV